MSLCVHEVLKSNYRRITVWKWQNESCNRVQHLNQKILVQKSAEPAGSEAPLSQFVIFFVAVV